MELNNKKGLGNEKAVILIILLSLLVVVSLGLSVFAAPQGATIIFNSTENASVRPADVHVAAGGSFTTLLLNVSSQTSKWKAYIGNVTGKLTLDNSNDKTIYDWVLTSIQGEVYISRNDSVVFSSLACANSSEIVAEDVLLNISPSADDSINSTFKQKIHKSFVIGGAGLIQNSTCYSIATYVNDSAQTPNEAATFQEVLLSDGKNLVFTSILEDDVLGFDLGGYDFQAIVPDNPGVISTPYYFYAELG